MSKRSNKFDKSFQPARQAASEAGLVLTNPGDGCYQLREPNHGWIINLYGRRKGFSPRAYHDPNHKGPYLSLPDQWDLIDLVEAAKERWLTEAVAKN